MKIAIVVLALLLGACAQAPKRTVTVTKADGHSYVTTVPEIADPRTYADGSRMNWVDVAFLKSQDALPPPPKPHNVWGCMAADFGSTAVGLSVGLREGNPLGWWLVPLNVGFAKFAQTKEAEGDPTWAKVYCNSKKLVVAWNILQILRAVKWVVL